MELGKAIIEILFQLSGAPEATKQADAVFAKIQSSADTAGGAIDKLDQRLKNLGAGTKNVRFDVKISESQRRATKATIEQINRRQASHNASIDKIIAKQKVASDRAVANAKRETDAHTQKWSSIMSEIRAESEANRRLSIEKAAAAQRDIAQRQRAATISNTRLNNTANSIVSPASAVQINALRERAQGISVLEQAQQRLSLTQKQSQLGLANLNREYDASLIQFGLYGSALGRQSQLFRDIGFQISDVGRGLTLLGAGLTATLAIPLKSFADFEQATVDVIAVLGDLETEGARAAAFKDLSQTFLELGETTEFTANQIAGAARQLGLAGFSTKEIQDSIRSISNLASAGNVDLDRAAKISVNIGRAFGIAASDLSRVSDTLAAISTNSNTTVESLAESFKLASPIAASLGQDLEIIGAAIGVLGNAGLSGTIAGTGINRFLSELLEKRDKVDELLQGIGSSFDRVDPTKLGLDEIIAEFTKLEELNLIDTETFFSTFDQRSARAVVTLVNQGTESFSRLTKAANESAGRASAIRDIRLDTTLGSWKIAISALTTSMIDLGKVVEPLARSLIAFLTDATRSLTETIRAYPGLFSGLTSAIASVAGVSLVLGPALSGLGLAVRGLGIAKLTQSLISVVPALSIFGGGAISGTTTVAGFGASATKAAFSFRALGSAILTGIGPIGLVIAAVGALTFAISSYESAALKAFDEKNADFFGQVEANALAASKTVSDLGKQLKSITDFVGGNDLQAIKFVNSDTDFIRGARDQVRELSNEWAILNDKLFETFELGRNARGTQNGLLGLLDTTGAFLGNVVGLTENVIGLEAVEQDGQKVLKVLKQFEDVFNGDTFTQEVQIKFENLKPKEQEIFNLIFRNERFTKEIQLKFQERATRLDLLQIADEDKLDARIDQIRKEADDLTEDIIKNKALQEQLLVEGKQNTPEALGLSVDIKKQEELLALKEQNFQLGKKLLAQTQAERDFNAEIARLQQQKSAVIGDAADKETQNQLDIAGITDASQLTEAAQKVIEAAKLSAGRDIDSALKELLNKRAEERQKVREADQRRKELLDEIANETDEIDDLIEKQQDRQEKQRIQDEGITKEDIEIEKLKEKIEKLKIQRNLISEINALGEGSSVIGKTFAGTDADGNDLFDDTFLTQLQNQKAEIEAQLAELDQREQNKGLDVDQQKNQIRLSEQLTALNDKITEFVGKGVEGVKAFNDQIAALQKISDEIKEKRNNAITDSLDQDALEQAIKNGDLQEQLRLTEKIGKAKNKARIDSLVSEGEAGADPFKSQQRADLEAAAALELQQQLDGIRDKAKKEEDKKQKKDDDSINNAKRKVKEQALAIAKKNKNLSEELRLTEELARERNKKSEDATISEDQANADANARQAKDDLEKSNEEALQQDLEDIRKKFADRAAAEAKKAAAQAKSNATKQKKAATALGKSNNGVAKAQANIQKSIGDQLAKQVRNQQDAVALQRLMVKLAGQEQARRLGIARSLAGGQSSLIKRITDGNFSQADKEQVARFRNEVGIKLPGFDTSLLEEAIAKSQSKNAPSSAVVSNNGGAGTTPNNQNNVGLDPQGNDFTTVFRDSTIKFDQSVMMFKQCIDRFKVNQPAPIQNPPQVAPPSNVENQANSRNDNQSQQINITIENINADGITREEFPDVFAEALKASFRGIR